MRDNYDHKYDDIINLPHYVSSTRPRMSRINRAAQFAPFAALTGYEDAVSEEARLTDQKIEMDENAFAVLDEKLQMMHALLPNCPEVKIMYFIPDENKSGGKYITITGCVKKIDSFERIILMNNQLKIPIDDIIGIECDVFSFDEQNC